VADGIVEGAKALYGCTEIGFHYNLHGGRPEEYLQYGGIRASRGDVTLAFTAGLAGSWAHSVYFFSSPPMNLYDILDQRNPDLATYWFLQSRMGSVLTLFRLDSDFLRRAFAEGGASNRTPISIDFDTGWLWRNNGGGPIGIPERTFLVPPIPVFDGVKKRLGLRRLRRDEETLAVMRYIEKIL
jgi:hypothetical protein